MTLRELLLPTEAHPEASALVDQILAGDAMAKPVYVDWLLERDMIIDESGPHHGWSGMHPLNQDETNDLIRAELYLCSDFTDAVNGGYPSVLGQHKMRTIHVNEWTHAANNQRGGIDSDLLIRYISRKAWGKRDEDERAIRAILESYRIKLGLQSWESIKPTIEINRGSGYREPIQPQVRRTGRTTHGILYSIASCVHRKQRTLYVADPTWHIEQTCRDIVNRLVESSSDGNHTFPVKLELVRNRRSIKTIYDRGLICYRDHHEAALGVGRIQLIHEMANAGQITSSEAERLMESPAADLMDVIRYGF